ncbi:small COPII vesicle coat GTPase Sar1 [Hamiltosporidium magnivora]|uniref:Small COPII vesicle coat GTPase Sar1 n=1 Tax=Hamiltosporidium magnivora TaxID=148818 RepID=A0A4Q9L2R2_9MICR|nr:small COPII vesicle coat GTPase Sar1 [Hamiltosporidium magnivora]
MNLEWKNVEIEILHDENKIECVLSNANGKIKSGSLCAVMGHKNIGKSVLLNTLADKLSPNFLIKVVNEKWYEKIGYVGKDICFYENLNQIKEDLQIKEISDLAVNVFDFDEKKQLKIATEFFNEPSRLFIDDPTHGLNSGSFNNLLKVLKCLCVKYKMTIIFTIQRPSDEVFNELDQLILLSNSHTVYSGESKKAEKFLQRMVLKTRLRTNPSMGLQEILEKTKQKLKDIYRSTIGYFIQSLFGTPVSILFLGIDNAGKTTLLNKLKNESTSTFVPTHHPMKNEIEIGNLRCNIIDLGGHKAARLAWNDYFYNCNGIVFIVDVSDTERFSIVREAYNTVRNMKIQRKSVKVPIAVLMNKIDLLQHTSESARNDMQFVDRLRNETGIEDMDDIDGQPVSVNYVSIKDESPTNLSGQLVHSFMWLEKMVNKKREIKDL